MNGHGRTEHFSYDKGDRLTSVTLDGQTSLFRYSASGNITYKSGLGSCFYGCSKPHALTSVENADSTISLRPQSITYTPSTR